MFIRKVPYLTAVVALTLSACSGTDDAPRAFVPSGAGGSAGVAGAAATAGTSSGGTASPGGVTSSAGTGGSALGQAGAAGSAATTGGAGGAGGATTAGSSAGGSAAGGSAGSTGGGTADPPIKAVMYLPNWSGTFASWAGKLDFSKMTHLDLAFGTIKAGSNDWSLGAPDDDVKAIAMVAHQKNVKVLVSIGGADDDLGIINRYATATNIDAMVSNLDAFITRLNLDGVDVDLERGSGLKASSNFPQFLSALIAKLRPQGRVVSCALAQYIIEDTGEDATQTAWLNSYDFINLMIYNPNMGTYTKELDWWTTQRKVPKAKLTWGVEFSNKTSVDYAKQLTLASKAYGGIMAWELSQPTAPALWKAIQDSL